MTKDFIYFKNKAKLAFRKRQYSRVLEILSCANVFLENLNAKQSLYFTMLCMLSDMALEYEDEARALFEYYQVIHNKNNLEAEEIVLEMIENFEVHSAKVGFKEAFEDLMFSSKIIFTNKNEFLFFVRNLVKFGFEDIAINYFENAGNLLFYDKDFMRLYRKILQNKKV
ncbi:hypothetical protein [Helicobacter sp. UBA3407]|uniref:hypothetical protein n=1 Tax=Helicobacter sp. UBA3407 TaxID=1946588 RepID=UPI0026151EFC|nr:hypothetical protein [Helicobacter sp. UBA3407]